MPSLVSQTPAASPYVALKHFSDRLAFETDCSDVYHSQLEGQVDYVLADVRGPQAFDTGHIPGAINLPQRTLTAEVLAAYDPATLFVVYCAGPHCNAVHRAAVRLAALGFPVKEMLGGITGWLDEGFTLTADRGVSLACDCA